MKNYGMTSFGDSILRPERPARNTVVLPRAPWFWAVFGLVSGCLLALLILAPARWLAIAVSDWSAHRVVLTDAQGSVWDGSAVLSLQGGAGSRDKAQLPGRVHWEMHLGLTTLHLALRAECCTQSAQALAFTLEPHGGGWTVRMAPSEAVLPANLLSGLGTPWNTMQPRGHVRFSSAGAELSSALNRLQLQGSLAFDMQDISARLSTLETLGSYRLEIQGGDITQLTLHTLRGSLQLNGQGQWANGHLHFEGEARAEAGSEEALSNLLNIIGRRDGARSVITLG